MLAVVLALAAAAGFGGSDFAAGLAARGASVVRVTITAGLAAMVVGLLIVPWVGGRAPSPASAAWGAAAGISGAAGAMALYLGFRHAAFSVASSLSAVGSAALSVLAGLLLGERPGWLTLAGISLALPAIAAVSASPGHPEPGGRSAEPQAAAATDASAGAAGGSSGAARAATGSHVAGVAYGLLAGACFALYFVGLSRAGTGGGLWPVLVAQGAALAAAGCAGAATGQLGLPPARDVPLSALTGVAGIAATICFFLATRAGLLAVTAVITSLYPAGTILLARVLLGERLTPARLAGLSLAAVSVALIAAGSVG